MKMRRSPTITSLKDVVFPFRSCQGGVGSFKAPLRERVSVPGRDEKSWQWQSPEAGPAWLFGRHPLGLSTCLALL